MSREDRDLRRTGPLAYEISDDQTVGILAVGSALEWRDSGNLLRSDGRIAFAEFEEIEKDLLARLCPTVILSPVLARNFDCIDLAEVLSKLGYAGRYRAVSDALPNPEMVEREIRSLCPCLDFAILIGH